MKKTWLCCLFLSLCFLLSCAPSVPAPPPPPSEAPEAGADLSDALPEAQDETSFFADSFQALSELLNSEQFLECEGVPTLCITAAFELSEPLVCPRATNVVYTPTQPCLWEEPLRIEFSEAASISLTTATASLVEAGCLTIDAPQANLTFSQGARPSESAAALYCNVKTLDGRPQSTVYGGAGTLVPTGVRLYSADGSFSFDGTVLEQRANLLTVFVPLIVPDALLSAAKLSFYDEFGAELVTLTADLISGEPLTLTDASGEKRTFFLSSDRLNYDVPIVRINTENSQPILDKENYVPARMTIGKQEYALGIRGRGNASWTQFPKKGYRLKLDQGASLFGMEKNRDWVLVSNYPDKSLIRNCVAHTVAASLSGIDYTPTHVPINLYLNGKYLGVYTFADKIENGRGRLSLGNTEGGEDIGFLIEIGWDFDGENVYNRDYFDTAFVLRLYVKEPKIERANTPEFLFAKRYVLEMEDAVVSNDGWEEYIDVDSWVDWFLVNELTFNTESSFYRSCYLYREEGGKLKLGPVWDFDMAFGNHQGDLPGYDGFCTTESTYKYITENWMDYLLRYDAFTARVKARWNEVKNDLKQTALSAVEEYSRLLLECQEQNFLVWDILDKQVGVGAVSPSRYPTYESQVEYVENFITERWQYLDERINRF